MQEKANEIWTKELIIKLKIKRIGDNIICYDSKTLQLILGTTGVYGLLDKYNIKEKNDKFYVPISSIKERKGMLTERKKLIEKYLSIMNQVLEEVKT